MIENMMAFSQWPRETQAACVAMYHMAHQGAAPKVEEKPTVIKASPARRKYHGPKPRWTDDERLDLFAEFDRGNRDWNALGRRFKRSPLAIRAQFDKGYAEFKAMSIS